MQPAKSPHRYRRRHQVGFTLIEVLVALVILAIGMLGTAGLTLSTLRSNQNAGYGSVAGHLATELQEIMAMNTDVVSDTSGGTTFILDTTGGTLPTAPTTNCLTSACNTPSQIYSYHIYDWAKRVQTLLPGGMVKVCRDDNPKDSNGVYRWACTAPTGGTGMLTVKIGWVTRADVGEGAFAQSGSDANPPRLVVTLYGSQQDIVNCGGSTQC